MKLRVISKEYEHKKDYNFSYYRIKFLGEYLEVTKDNIPFIEIMQFWFARKASKSCYIWSRKFPHSLKYKIIAHFWSKLEWYWRRLYHHYRRVNEQ